MENISYEEWETRIYNAVKKRNELWDLFKTIEFVIPDKYKLSLLLNVVYVTSDFIDNDFFTYLEDLILNETEESKLFRQEQNTKMIKCIGSDLVDENGYIEIYRGTHCYTNNEFGINEANRDYEHAISWSFNKTVAEFFAIRFKSEDCHLIKAKVHIDDVLTINLDRHEYEIIIVSPVFGGKLYDVEVNKIVPDIKIMEQFNQLR